MCIYMYIYVYSYMPICVYMFSLSLYRMKELRPHVRPDALVFM